MTFELDAGGVRVWCSSPAYTRKLVEKGARLVDPAQAAYLGDDEPAIRPVGAHAKKRQARSDSSSPAAS